MAKAPDKKTSTTTGSAVKKTAAKVAAAVSEAASAVTAPAKPSRARAPKAAASKPAPTAPAASDLGRTSSAPARNPVVMTVTHDQIAQKAYEIWMAKGCPQGRDDENWREAEALLSKRGG